MKERPILCNGPMVRALLRKQDPKTQTRRIIKASDQQVIRDLAGEDSQDDDAQIEFAEAGHSGPGWYVGSRSYPDEGSHFMRCPFGQPGDRLWVRETFAPVDYLVGGELEEPVSIAFRADQTAWAFDVEAHENPRRLDTYAWPWSRLKWKPPMFMPRWAARLIQEVTRLRVERVQSITDADAVAEGVLHWAREVLWPRCELLGVAKPDRPRFLFQLLWQEIYGAESWKGNPRVWVVDFRRFEGGRQLAGSS